LQLSHKKKMSSYRIRLSQNLPTEEMKSPWSSTSSMVLMVVEVLTPSCRKMKQGMYQMAPHSWQARWCLCRYVTSLCLTVHVRNSHKHLPLWVMALWWFTLKIETWKSWRRVLENKNKTIIFLTIFGKFIKHYNYSQFT